MLTGPADTSSVGVQPPATGLSIISGDDQTGGVLTQLPESLVVRAIADDGLGVAGVDVLFAPSDSTATVSMDTVVTDSNGRAAVLWTAGQLAGPRTLTASLPGVSTADLRATVLLQGVASDFGV